MPSGRGERSAGNRRQQGCERIRSLRLPDWHTRREKAFFFEKKKQKAFVCSHLIGLAIAGGRRTTESFLVLFFKKGLPAWMGEAQHGRTSQRLS
jgi:hypothetical protein